MSFQVKMEGAKFKTNFELYLSENEKKMRPF
jgi:hypothetical protein